MSNIEIGIDLGTTNSEIVIFNNGQYEVVKNTYGDEFTPSVFGVSKGKTEEVGKKPYERYFKDASADEVLNNKPEVKRLMGTSDKVNFPRINKSYNAEEISSKILKYLKQEAMRKKSDLNTNGVVITIPAHFSTIQAEATKRAGELAGFKYVELLQEPISAAISYGFGKAENENWLVYDLGGGTFDSAIISARDGSLKVLSHNGDNFLGGKDIDNFIVDKIILPELYKKYDIQDFSRNKKEYSTQFAKLKYSAEQAKIQLSTMNEVTIEVDININGEEIYENILLSRDTLKNVLNDLINKTVSLCKKTIEDSNIKQEFINKIIFVGGPTQLPFIKEILERDLGIKVDTSSDPLTAVARGACIYGSGRSIPSEYNEKKIVSSATYKIELNYESLTQSDEELVTGRVEGLDEKDYFIQIQSKDNTYNTGKIKIENNTFMANVIIRSNMANSFWVYLFDDEGNTLETDVDEFSIMHGLSVQGAPIPYSIGVGITKKDFATNTSKHVMDWFFQKDSILPLEKTQTYKTIRTIDEGEEENSLPITVYEGENLNPDYNTFICNIALTGDMIGGCLYEGSEVEITIKVDTSRTITLSAYIPDLDKTFDVRSTIHDENISVSVMENTLKKEEEKIEDIKRLCSSEEKEKIEREIDEVKRSLRNAQTDEDEKRKVNSQLKNLQSQINKLKESKNSKAFEDKYYKLLKQVKEEFEKLDNNSSRSYFQSRMQNLENEGRQAVQKNNVELLQRINEQLNDLYWEIRSSGVEYWKEMFGYLYNNNHIKSNPQCSVYLSRGERAYTTNNLNELMICVNKLWNFLPNESKNEINQNLAGITK